MSAPLLSEDWKSALMELENEWDSYDAKPNKRIRELQDVRHYGPFIVAMAREIEARRKNDGTQEVADHQRRDPRRLHLGSHPMTGTTCDGPRCWCQEAADHQ